MNTLAKIIIITAVFLAGFYFGQRQAVAPADPAENPAAPEMAGQEAGEIITVSQFINYGEERITSFENLAVTAPKSVFDLLEETTAAHDIELQYKDYGGDLGAMVEAIGTAANDFSAGRYWQYWLNGEYALVGASAQALKDGDMVEWKLTGEVTQ